MHVHRSTDGCACAYTYTDSSAHHLHRDTSFDSLGRLLRMSACTHVQPPRACTRDARVQTRLHAKMCWIYSMRVRQTCHMRVHVRVHVKMW